MNLQFVQDAILQHKDEFAAFGLRRIGIFGSLATGVSTMQSDIDLLLEFDPQKKPTATFTMAPYSSRHSSTVRLTR